MKVITLSESVKYRPHKDHYVIRIFPSWTALGPIREGFPLIESLHYVYVAEYIFDNVVSSRKRGGMKAFDEHIALNMLEGFSRGKEDVEVLLVNSPAGEKSGPAVLIAMNEVFRLGHDTEELKSLYRDYNPFIYETLNRVARGDLFLRQVIT